MYPLHTPPGPWNELQIASTPHVRIFSTRRWAIGTKALKGLPELSSTMASVQQHLQQTLYADRVIDEANRTPFNVSVLGTVARMQTGEHEAYYYAPATEPHCEGGHGTGELIVLLGAGSKCSQAPPLLVMNGNILYANGRAHVHMPAYV